MVLLLSAPRLIWGGDDEEEREKKAYLQKQRTEILSYFLKDQKTQLPQTPLAVELYNQGAEYFLKHEYVLARQTLQDSIAFDERNPFAYELLGDIDYQEQKPAEALENYKKAYRLRPNKELRKKIEKLLREIPVEQKLTTLREENFVIQYQGELSPEEVKALTQSLEKMYQQVASDFGFHAKQPIAVTLYNEEDFKKVTELPHWFGGIYDGKIKLPSGQETFADPATQALMIHEITHAVVGAISAKQAPLWINEGLAEYEENKIKPGDHLILDVAIQSNSLLPVDQLMNEEDLVEKEDPLALGLFYEQSYSLTNYLVDRYGMFKVKELLIEFGKGKNSDEALSQVLKINTEDLEKEWKAAITK
jgi:tetratricopeptide (TPR) repeat protein